MSGPAALLPINQVLRARRSGPDEPIVFVLRLARPRIEFTDHGKTAVVIPGSSEEEDADYDDGGDDE
jgi:hypothetical protein